MDGNTEYCWYEDGIETVHGPLDSIAAAERDIWEHLDDDLRPVSIARVKHVDPCEHVTVIDVDDLLERMDEHLADGFAAFDGPVFEVHDDEDENGPVTARDALEAALKKWAERHVTAGGMWYAGEIVKSVDLSVLNRQRTPVERGTEP